VVAAAPPLFETLRWTAPGAELEALSSQPSACLYFDPQNEAMVQAGQALFNTPTLLGGQAAKAGLNCASCHVSGRGNPHFLMNGVSEGPGTADVSHSFFSAARGNGRFDPVPIPDLAKPGKVSRDPATKALEPFIRTLIVEEFAGHEPSPAMLEALAAYVRSIQNCPGGDKNPVPRKLENQLGLVQAATNGAVNALGWKDEDASRLLIAAARYQLGLIAERYAGPKLASERKALLAESRRLQLLADQSAPMEKRAEGIFNWQNRFEKNVSKDLRRSVDKSLYNPTLLAAKLNP
jgi:hypothetical protein